MWHYVGCFSNFSLPLCRGSSKYRKPEKRSEEDSNSSFMAALRLKVAEKKLEKISLMALKFSSSTIFSHLQPSSIGSLVYLVTLSQVCHAFLDKHGKKCEMLQRTEAPNNLEHFAIAKLAISKIYLHTNLSFYDFHSSKRL